MSGGKRWQIYKQRRRGADVSFKKPRPRPPAAAPARETLSEASRAELASKAHYVGSPYHTDIPKFGLQANPRTGATTIERAEDQRLKNPTCTICPRKWARRLDEVTALLRRAIEAGNYIANPHGGLPAVVWARDPANESLVYEAKLSQPPGGYKGYPLTQYQAEYNLPFRIP
jgi:hypothetical protein